MILGRRVDFGQIIVNYTTVGGDDHRRYAPPTASSCEMRAELGQPSMDNICTSHFNRSMRMGMRRLTRLTNAHSTKRENYEAALALWFAYYNYCRVHSTLKMNPAHATGLTDHAWPMLELIEAVATH